MWRGVLEGDWLGSEFRLIRQEVPVIRKKVDPQWNNGGSAEKEVRQENGFI